MKLMNFLESKNYSSEEENSSSSITIKKNSTSKAIREEIIQKSAIYVPNVILF